MVGYNDALHNSAVSRNDFASFVEGLNTVLSAVLSNENNALRRGSAPQEKSQGLQYLELYLRRANIDFFNARGLRVRLITSNCLCKSMDKVKNQEISTSLLHKIHAIEKQDGKETAEEVKVGAAMKLFASLVDDISFDFSDGANKEHHGEGGKKGKQLAHYEDDLAEDEDMNGQKESDSRSSRSIDGYFEDSSAMPSASSASSVHSADAAEHQQRKSSHNSSKHTKHKDDDDDDTATTRPARNTARHDRDLSPLELENGVHKSHAKKVDAALQEVSVGSRNNSTDMAEGVENKQRTDSGSSSVGAATDGSVAADEIGQSVMFDSLAEASRSLWILIDNYSI